eukprot:m.248940 g.248940  ORF g.248940 m.248940 type:complete len:881 (-) comp15424_c0_seq4:2797-5439(-)
MVTYQRCICLFISDVVSVLIATALSLFMPVNSGINSSILVLTTAELQAVIVPLMMADSLQQDVPTEVCESEEMAEVQAEAEDALEQVADALAKVELSVSQFEESQQEQPLPELPESYRTNTAKEQKTLSFVKNFQRQFSQMYRQRKPVPLILPNEAGVQKFICTTVRPTLLPFPALATHDGAAAFVADFLTYKELDPPTEQIAELPSPTTILWRQSANCFEASVVLCSLLEGAGFEAYCVSGYASREVCLRSRLKSEKLLAQHVDVVEDKAEKKKESKYKIQRGGKLKSAFDTRMAARETKTRKDAVAKAAAATEAERQEKLKAAADELHGVRVHAWVLVLPGKRGIPEPFFIEPTTGSCVSTLDPNYLGLEFVWNSQNAFVNMQRCTYGLKDMQYDVLDGSCWEPVFPIDHGDADVGPSVDLPPSWVEKLSIEPKDYELRCPHGTRDIHLATQDITLYAEYLRDDGLVRLTKDYENEELAVVVRETKTYMHRADGLLKSTIQFVNTDSGVPETSFVYAPGHPFRVQKNTVTEESTPTRTLKFYADARADGLAERLETPHELEETFRGRRDRLVTRKVTFSTDELPHTVEGIEFVSETYSRDPSKPADKDIQEIVYFSDAIQITFHLAEGNISQSKIELEKPQRLGGKDPMPITAADVDVYSAASDKPMFRTFELYELQQKGVQMEAVCKRHVKQSLKETDEILKKLEDDSTQVDLMISFYDTMRNEESRRQREEQEKQARLEEERQRQQREDYLAPFLARLPDSSNLTVEDAVQLKQQCIDDLKATLKRRLAILNEEAARLEREHKEREEQYNANHSSLTADEEREHFVFCQNTLFKIRVLKMRMERHARQTPIKEQQLKAKLNNDPRLSVLLRQAGDA